MSDLITPNDDNRINETERRFNKITIPGPNWDTCAFCGDKPATHETSAWDYVCEACWIGFESYLSHAYGTCETCQSPLSSEGTCRNCEYLAWHAEHGMCKQCGKELEFSSKPNTPFWVPCDCTD